MPWNTSWTFPINWIGLRQGKLVKGCHDRERVKKSSSYNLYCINLVNNYLPSNWCQQQITEQIKMSNFSSKPTIPSIFLGVAAAEALPELSYMNNFMATFQFYKANLHLQ